MTKVSEPDESVEIPESIQLGETITVKGQRIRANHILVKEIQADMKYSSQFLGKAGDSQCVIVESLENLPDDNESGTSERLWIIVEDCEPLSVQPRRAFRYSSGQVLS